MTVITHARRASKLSKMIDAPGGISVRVALNQARANMEAMRAEAMASVDAQITVLETLGAPETVAATPARLAEAYRAATGVIDGAGPFNMKELCLAAGGLCDLIDAAVPGQPFDWRVVKVHGQALRLLRVLPVDEVDARARIIEDLSKVVVRKIAQPG